MFNTNLYELINSIYEEGYKFPNNYYYKNGELNYFRVSKVADAIADELIKDRKIICMDSLIFEIADIMIKELNMKQYEINKKEITFDKDEDIDKIFTMICNEIDEENEEIKTIINNIKY